MSQKPSTGSIMVKIVSIVALVIILASLPVTFIWALNTLFPLLAIELSWSTYFASWVLLSFLKTLTTNTASK